jgi:prevent-host-death family protein
LTKDVVYHETEQGAVIKIINHLRERRKQCKLSIVSIINGLQIMQTTTSGEFHRKIGHYQDRALVEPIMVTRNGRQRVVLISADEYDRLKKLDRQALYVSELSDEELAAIAAAEVPAEYAHLDEELRS